MAIKIIIGLGNEGEKYAKTYHNAGWIFVDAWNEKNRDCFAKPRNDEDGAVRCMDIPAVKTEGFMNQSGDAVSKILKDRGLKVEDALIVHDDSDIYIGEYKISRNRGAAGHKGVEHIMAVLGTKDFTRLRIGIRPKQKEGAARKKADEFVLKNISVANIKILQRVFGEAVSRLSS